jgi:hypothetical protein
VELGAEGFGGRGGGGGTRARRFGGRRGGGIRGGGSRAAGVVIGSRSARRATDVVLRTCWSVQLDDLPRWNPRQVWLVRVLSKSGIRIRASES